MVEPDNTKTVPQPILRGPPLLWVVEFWSPQLQEWLPSQDFGFTQETARRKQKARWTHDSAPPTRIRSYIRRYIEPRAHYDPR
jgi:hypothetical protein